METESANWSRVAEVIESLRQELARLGERVAALEKAAGSGGVTRPEPADAARSQTVAQQRDRPRAPVEEDLSEEIVLIISAAVAAFLGKKAPIRQIRLLGSTAWAQQGRVTIQASHTLEAHTGRRQP
jgi:methylmalonyl-CoA carboxyltransferase 12S subunit